MDIEDFKTWTDIASKLASAAAIVAAAAWFVITTKFRQRVQFDLACSFLIVWTETFKL